jgi:hypothetical protein
MVRWLNGGTTKPSRKGVGAGIVVRREKDRGMMTGEWRAQGRRVLFRSAGGERHSQGMAAATRRANRHWVHEYQTHGASMRTWESARKTGKYRGNCRVVLGTEGNASWATGRLRARLESQWRHGRKKAQNPQEPEKSFCCCGFSRVLGAMAGVLQVTLEPPHVGCYEVGPALRCCPGSAVGLQASAGQERRARRLRICDTAECRSAPHKNWLPTRNVNGQPILGQGHLDECKEPS